MKRATIMARRDTQAKTTTSKSLTCRPLSSMQMIFLVLLINLVILRRVRRKLGTFLIVLITGMASYGTTLPLDNIALANVGYLRAVNLQTTIQISRQTLEKRIIAMNIPLM